MVCRKDGQDLMLLTLMPYFAIGNFFPSEKLCSGFEDRDGVMEELRKKIHSIQNDNEMPVGLLHGVPGIGKTQVCLKFAKTLKERSVRTYNKFFVSLIVSVIPGFGWSMPRVKGH